MSASANDSLPFLPLSVSLYQFHFLYVSLFVSRFLTRSRSIIFYSNYHRDCVSLFSDKIKKLLKNADFRRYRFDDVIIRQGDIGDE